MCLANMQELIVASAIASKKSDGAIAKLCVGVRFFLTLNLLSYMLT